MAAAAVVVEVVEVVVVVIVVVVVVVMFRSHITPVRSFLTGKGGRAFMHYSCTSERASDQI